jgi:ubiquinone/menaquinone biosynthesis C-methylase UbiE
MNSVFKWSKLLYTAAKVSLSKVKSDPTSDFNTIAASYNAYHLNYLGKKALEMWEKLPVKTGQHIVDLACGTGFFTHRLAEKVGNQGKVYAVDLSPNMLQCNKDNAASQGFSNITFIESDALSFLSNLPDNSIDGVVCAWAISYMNHEKLIQEIERVVKPRGFLGLIDKKVGSLKDVSSIFTKVILDYPHALIKNIVTLVPIDKNYLVETFCSNKFQAQVAWEGQLTIPCKNGKEVAEYIINSGSAAGILDALDKQIHPQFIQSFITYADESFANDGELPVTHDFCGLVATKIY